MFQGSSLFSCIRLCINNETDYDDYYFFKGALSGELAELRSYIFLRLSKKLVE